MTDRQSLLDIASRAMGTRKGLLTRETGYLLHHGQRAAAIALQLCQHLDEHAEVDRAVLYAAALFHDVGKGIDPHTETGAVLARTLLRDACAPEESEQIAQLIQQHNKRGQAGIPLAAGILQDADVLDHFGSQAVWLSFLFNAHTEKGPRGSLDYYEGDTNRQYQQCMRLLLNYDYSREVFDKRLAVEQSFFQRFREEMDGAL